MTRPGSTVPPPALQDWCRRFGGTSLSAEDQAALLEGAVMALRASLTRHRRDRDAAFMLLAADALLTRACESAVDTVDPAEAFEAVLTKIGSAFPS